MMSGCITGKAVAGRRTDYIIATKFGVAVPSKTSTGASTAYGVNGDPQYVRGAVEASLKRLGIKQIDLYYQHRVDRSRPIEETWACLKVSAEHLQDPISCSPPQHACCA